MVLGNQDPYISDSVMFEGRFHVHTPWNACQAAAGDAALQPAVQLHSAKWRPRRTVDYKLTLPLLSIQFETDLRCVQAN